MMKKNRVLPDSVSYNTIINGLCKDNRLLEVRDLFQEMKVGDYMSNLTALIHVFLRMWMLRRWEGEDGFGGRCFYVQFFDW